MSKIGNITHAQRMAAANKAEALGLSHAPYQFGAAGPVGYDCSGLTMVAWRAGGLELPHNSHDQAEFLGMMDVSHDALTKLRPGDLVFYTGELSPGEKPPGHVAMFLREFAGYHVVAQATDTAHGSEIIKLHKYVQPIGFGFVGHA